MRILHVGKFYPPYQGGMENFLRDVLKALRKEGVFVSGLVHHHLPNQPFSYEEDDGIPIWRVPSLGQLLYLPVSPTFPVRLRRAIREFRPDVLHFHFPNPSACWSLLVPEALALPWIVQWQSDVVPSGIDRRLRPAYQCFRPLEQAFLKKTKRIIVASPPYLEYSEPLRRWVDKCCLVPLGIDPERLPWPEPGRIDAAERKWAPGMLKVLAVGRLTYYKGFDVLIRAAQRVPGVSVQVVGDGVLMAGLREKIRQSGVHDRVLMRGALSDTHLQALLAACDLLCLPSVERTEAFGIVLLEAMRYGKALVVSDIPGSGAGWVVRKGACGVLVPPGDERSLARVLDHLASHPAVCKEMGGKGEASLRGVFHIGSIASRIKDIYGRIIEGL